MPRPDAVANVLANSPATSSWANDVADGINAVVDDIYGATVGSALAIPWANVTGKPSTFSPSDHATDHAQGGGDELTPEAIDAWRKGTAGSAPGNKIYVGPTAPGAPVEGDIWVKG